MNNLSPRKRSLWKGKEKAEEPVTGDPDFEDLNPVITYRHILSRNLGVRDPLRVIALCDSDAFYAACEMNRLGVADDVPLVVLQWDALIAVNYPARKYGISRMCKKKEALKLCPHLRVVHVATYKEGEKEPGYWEDVDTNTHKVSLDYYRRESMKIAAMFKEQVPGCEVEKASIDEAFFDFTLLVREILLQRYPYLAQVPADAPNGVDTPLPPPPPISWDGLGNLVPVYPPLPPPPPPPPPAAGEEPSDIPLEGGSTREESKPSAEVESHQREEPPLTWHDVALSIGAELMGKAREEVRTKINYTTSAGIARNKFLAKLTASYKKLNQQTILRNAAIPNYLRPLEFQKIRNLGGKLGEALAKEYDVSTVGDLLTISLADMQNRFGEESAWVYEVIRGIDRNEVKDKGSVLNKSMLASKNLPQPITKPSEGYHWIRVLAAELALRLNDARGLSPNLWPKTLVLHARKGYEAGRSKQTPFPFTKDLTVDTIAAAGDKLWKDLVGTNSTMKVTNVSLAFTGIDVAEAGQQSIADFLHKPVSSSKKRSRDDAEAATLSRGHTPKQAAIAVVSDSDGTALHNQPPNGLTVSYSCARCGKTFKLPLTDQTSGDQEELLMKAKLEHDDYHFAQDLAKENDPGRPAITADSKPPSSSSNGKPKSKPKSTAAKPTKKRKPLQPEPKGIEKFFRK